MKIGSTMIGEHGQYVVNLPKGAKPQSAVAVSNQFQVFYTCDDNSGPQEAVDLRVVSGGETYEDSYQYLEAVTVSSGDVRHVLYRPAKTSSPPQVNPLAAK